MFYYVPGEEEAKTKPVAVPEIIKNLSFPIHFYAMMNDLTGRDATYNNPAVSLRSLIVSRYLDRELVYLSSEMFENYQACVEFSEDRTMGFAVAARLIKNSNSLIEEISKFDVEHQKPFVDQLTLLNTVCVEISKAFSNLKEDDIISSEMKEKLYDFQELVLSISWSIEEKRKLS